MPWVKLSQLPGMRAFSDGFTDLVRWEIRDGSVWFHGSKRLRSANADSFELWGDDCTFLARDDAHVYYGASILRKIDVKMFEALGCRYFRDEKFAYIERESSLATLKGRDVPNFQVLGNGYARDSVYGYYWGSPLRACINPLSLRLIESDIEFADSFAQDDRHIYYEQAALKDVDPATWELLPQGCFSWDAERVYWGASKLPGANRNTWKILEAPYSNDSRSVYFTRFRLRGANPVNFRLLEDGYSTDGVHVYFIGGLVEGADAATFKVTSKCCATDKYGGIERGYRVKK